VSPVLRGALGQALGAEEAAEARDLTGDLRPAQHREQLLAQALRVLLAARLRLGQFLRLAEA